MTQYEHEYIGTNICPGVFYTIPGDRSGKLYSFNDLPYAEDGNRLMGCKVVDSHPCTRCGKCGHQPPAPSAYFQVSYETLRFPGLIY
jgi:hypothetical protein